MLPAFFFMVTFFLYLECYVCYKRKTQHKQFKPENDKIDTMYPCMTPKTKRQWTTEQHPGNTACFRQYSMFPVLYNAACFRLFMIVQCNPTMPAVYYEKVPGTSCIAGMMLCAPLSLSHGCHTRGHRINVIIFRF